MYRAMIGFEGLEEGDVGPGARECRERDRIFDLVMPSQ